MGEGSGAVGDGSPEFSPAGPSRARDGRVSSTKGADGQQQPADQERQTADGCHRSPPFHSRQGQSIEAARENEDAQGERDTGPSDPLAGGGPGGARPPPKGPGKGEGGTNT